MSVDRQSVANDLNAIANAVTREEDLESVLAEIDIVLENIVQLTEELIEHDAAKEETA